MTVVDYSVLTKKKPEKGLTFGRKRMVGRASNGRITVRHRGGGVKKLYRTIDFRQDISFPGKVVAIEYDPNRTAFIALVIYKNGEKRYILAPKDLKIGTVIAKSEDAALEVGNRLPLRKIPVGYFVHNVELLPGKGGQIVRSAGSAAQILARDGGYVHLQMPSSEVRKIVEECWASVGFVSNPDHNLVVIGKAGRARHMGRRPSVRGTAMNPVDHPHGGGEGRQPIGLKHPKTPWGKPALGVKTRRKKKTTNIFIVRRRVKK
ncbi:MAG: 50S ribosomal protein L2 [Parcubacteria group bacterium GW2011_GWD2_38_12]|uniref:Large ribosomal subunit protein uL2 n=1 Tax=Candidatus Azambacteria bacterium RIFCSPLOWO2_01_FULL_37_9 TaxID=1797297 RepID=A0A1F5C6C9_9BACT|nr:MAG: 50S ribosomal protein L2 [Parcubacteria group bacterium GW2011_GWC2_36_17]KKQ43574.1 MAG: 50S ribosomal protein L2 [Parcubacteria group bacterium GW2011_GWE2_37_8]KKQ52189.1 MAG: 50S ribosomal protein L2 [Parcubacteria group bacterium GW2011_GWD2_38_12]KKQ58915.1 MAG: 50S ribosomal protein L2 [Parcubacteria group bacterium GW2011_GWC1_38_17]OGD38426.1 MAG: 50S ribosomal protein L2 [Candidatus Azambacteria bacterium RIFCSPLOWO2_01_FULL_37_9]